MARIRRWQRWLIVGIAVVAALAVAGPFVYIHFIEGKAPKRLSLSSTRGTATTVASGAAADIPLDGTWKVAVELLELSRIPEANDVLGSYEAELDESGELLGYQRVRRYARSQRNERQSVGEG